MKALIFTIFFVTFPNVLFSQNKENIIRLIVVIDGNVITSMSNAVIKSCIDGTVAVNATYSPSKLQIIGDNTDSTNIILSFSYERIDYKHRKLKNNTYFYEVVIYKAWQKYDYVILNIQNKDKIKKRKGKLQYNYSIDTPNGRMIKL